MHMARTKIQLPKHFISDSWHLVKDHKALYFFPLMNVIFSSVLVFTFITAAVFPFFRDELTQHASGPIKALTVKIIIGLVAILLLPIISNVINAAIFFYSNALLENRSETVSGALGLAIKRTPSLILWSLIQGTVGFFLNLMTSSKHPLADLIIDLIFGVAWSLLSFFVLPVILFENKSTFLAIKESIQLARNLWGKRGFISFGLWGLLTVFLFLLGVGVIALGWRLHDQWSFVVIGIGIVYLIAVAYTNRLIRVIVQIQLYKAIKNGAYVGSVGAQ